MVIVDSHAHIFPYLGGESGYDSADEHLAICQKVMNELVQPARRTKDNLTMSEKNLWSPTDQGLGGRYEVNFRAGRYGRFEWRRNGIDYYIQFLPPTLENTACPPEMLLAMMDNAGIDMAVLQRHGVYGKLNEYYAEIMKQKSALSERFIPLAQLDEKRAYGKEEMNRLVQAIKTLSLRGLWFGVNSLQELDGEKSYFGPYYKQFWNCVRELGIPVFLSLHAPKGIWLQMLERMNRWVQDYPDIPCILPEAFPLSTSKEEDEVDIPAFAEKMIRNGNILVELVYPISRGRIEDYPYPITRKAIRKLYETFGGQKLVWGSDVPMVERFCTYKQALAYLKNYCTFISKEDMDLVLGKNILKVFGYTNKA